MTLNLSLIHFNRYVQYLIATSMASGPQRKRGKSDKRKGKKLKVAYENVHVDGSADGDAVAVSSSSWTPKNWGEQYANIKKMREKFDAPVDTVGASKLADPSALPEVCGNSCRIVDAHVRSKKCRVIF